jgi:hypothetical protein
MPDVAIGTNSETYTLLPGDVAEFIFCDVRATNAVGNTTARSNTVGPIAAAGAGTVPINTTAPAIDDDTPVIGETLTCDNGAWTNTPTGYAFQWFYWIADVGGVPTGTPIPSANAATYELVDGGGGTSTAGQPIGLLLLLTKAA